MSVVADELTLKIDSNVTGAIAGMSAVEAKSKGMASKVAASALRMGKMAAVGVGVAAVAVGVGASKMAMDFEKSMAQIEALVGVPKDEMAELEEAALAVGAKFGVGADEAASGLFFLKSAGLETADAIGALDGAAMASAMGLGEMEDLANTATTAMSNFGLDSVGAYDRIAKAAQLAKADPAELGKIMNNNSASASLVGMTYDDLGATLALLTVKFGDSRKAGTGMDGILRKLVKPSAQAKDMLDQVGVSAADFQAMLAEDLPGGLATLDAAFAANGTSQSEWLGMVFEDGEAIKAAAAIIGTEGAEIERVFGGMGESAGMLEDGWAIMSETASVKMSQAMESVKSALIPVGLVILDIVIPAISALGEWLTKAVEWFQGLISPAEETEEGVGGAFGGIVEAGKGLLDALQGYWDAIRPIIQAIGEIFVEVFIDVIVPAFTTLLEWVTKALTWFTDLIGGAEGLQEGFGGAFDGIKEMVAGVREWWDEHFDDIKDIVERFREHFETIVADILAYAQPKLDEMAVFFTETFAGMIDWFQENWPAIKETIEIVLDKIKALWDFIWPYLQMFLDESWESMKAIVTGAINLIQGILEVIMGVIRGDWDQAWEGIKKILSALWDTMYAIVGNKLALVRDIITRLTARIREIIQEKIDAVKRAWTTFWDNMKTKASDGLIGVYNKVVEKFLAVKAWIEEKLAVVKGIWDGVWDTMADAVGTAFEAVAGAVKVPINAMLGVLETGINSAIRLLNKAIDGVNLINPFSDVGKVGEISVPRLKDGGYLNTGGPVKVGDNGPEVVNLPKGASVTPLRGDSQSGEGGIYIEHLHSGADPHELAEELGWELTKRGM